MTRPLIAATLVAFAAAGCGGSDDFANEPNPPAPINVTAAISDDRVRVSPRRFGAGPIVLIIANESARAHEVTLETDAPAEGTPGLRQRTSPVNPRGTAELKVDVPEGKYSVSVASRRVRPAAVRVDGARASAQNDLLQP